MHPGFMAWWRHHAHRHWEEHWGAGSGDEVACVGAPRGRCGPRRHAGAAYGVADDVGAGFGVRRPLRFLAHRLDLNESQVAELATILGELKTERAQVAVDERRRVSVLADAIEGAELDEQKLEQAASVQTESAQRLRAAVSLAVRKMHAVLTPEQRRTFAYLLRTGALSI